MKYILPLLACAMVFFTCAPTASAETGGLSLQLSPSSDQLTRDQTFQIELSLKENPHAKLTAAQWLVNYDDRLILTSVKPNPKISNCESEFTIQSNSAQGVYTSGKAGIPWETEFLTLEFKVSENAQPGPAHVTVTMENLVDTDLQRSYSKVTQSISLSVRQPEVPRAFLEKLSPSTGTLSPAFSPDRTNYEITVPYEVTSLTFEVQPGAQGTAQVNRKNLERAGTPTVFTITVTASDQKAKMLYTVTVHRLEKPSASSFQHSAPAQTSSSKLLSSRAASSKSASSKPTGEVVKSSAKEDLTTSSMEEPATSQLPRTASYQYGYVPQKHNRMSAFLRGILFVCAAVVMGGMLVALLVNRHNRRSKK